MTRPSEPVKRQFQWGRLDFVTAEMRPGGFRYKLLPARPILWAVGLTVFPVLGGTCATGHWGLTGLGASFPWWNMRLSSRPHPPPNPPPPPPHPPPSVIGHSAWDRIFNIEFFFRDGCLFFATTQCDSEFRSAPFVMRISCGATALRTSSIGTINSANADPLCVSGVQDNSTAAVLYPRLLLCFHSVNVFAHHEIRRVHRAYTVAYATCVHLTSPTGPSCNAERQTPTPSPTTERSTPVRANAAPRAGRGRSPHPRRKAGR